MLLLPPAWIWIVVANILACAIASSDEDKVSIELTELNYEDNCYAVATAEWAYIDSFYDQKAFEAWNRNLTEYGKFKKSQCEETANVSKTTLDDITFRHKFDVIEQAGDALLEKTDWDRLVHFITSAEALRASATYEDQQKIQYLRSGVERLLAQSKDAQEEYIIWSSWYRMLNPLVTNYSDVLHLIEKAAARNGAKDVTEYWQLLSQYPNAYEQIKEQWNTVTSLHQKIQQFARLHLSRKYGINITEAIPAHLLGSLQGYEWNTLSLDVSPYAEITYDIRKQLWKQEILGESLYKVASEMGSLMLGQVPQLDFWNKSRFDRYCPSKLINFCNGTTRVFTCFEPTVDNFLRAHKNVGKVLFNQMSIVSSPVLNIANRYSVLEEGIAELFAILSISPAWLSRAHLMVRENQQEEQQIVSLMITALDVLPRLAYYMSVDMWRLNALANDIREPSKLIESWWEHRQKYEGITISGSKDLPTFLNDEYITSNKPYLAKFLGVLLGFQLYEYIMDSTEVRYDNIDEKETNANIIKLIQQGAGGNCQKALDKYLDISQITENSLISFFTPLQEFMDELEENTNYYPISTLEAELIDIEQSIVDKFNSSNVTESNNTTNSTTTTTTTPAATNTVSSMSSKSKSTNESKSVVQFTESDSSVQADKPEIERGVSSSFERPTDFGKYDEQGNKTPKTNATNTAVWAVTSVLVAIITACAIVIFCRYRCRKTPKNRPEYV